MIERDIFDHKACIYAARFVCILREDITRVSPPLMLDYARSTFIEMNTETASCIYSDWQANKPTL